MRTKTPTALALLAATLLSTGCPRTYVSIETLRSRAPFSYRLSQGSYATDVDPAIICAFDWHHGVKKWGEAAEDGTCRPIAAAIDPAGVAWPAGVGLEELVASPGLPCVGVFDERPMKRLPYEGLYLLAPDETFGDVDVLVVWDEAGLRRVGAQLDDGDAVLEAFTARTIGHDERRQLQFCGLTEGDVAARGFPRWLATATEAVGALGEEVAPAELARAAARLRRARDAAPTPPPPELATMQERLLAKERALYGLELQAFVAGHEAPASALRSLGAWLEGWSGGTAAPPPIDPHGDLPAEARRAREEVVRAVQHRGEFAARRARVAAARELGPVARWLAVLIAERTEPRPPAALFASERADAERALLAAIPELEGTRGLRELSLPLPELLQSLQPTEEALPAREPLGLDAWRRSFLSRPTPALLVALAEELERRDGGRRSTARAREACGSVATRPATALGLVGRLVGPDEALRRCASEAAARLAPLAPPRPLGESAACRRLATLIAASPAVQGRTVACRARVERRAEVVASEREEPITEEYVTVEENPAWSAFQGKARRWREELDDLRSVGIVTSRVESSREAESGLTGGYDCDSTGQRCTPRRQGGGEAGSSAWSRGAWGEAMAKNQRRADELAALLASEPPWKLEVKRTRVVGRRRVPVTVTKLAVEGALELEGRATTSIAWRVERGGRLEATDDVEAEGVEAALRPLATELRAEARRRIDEAARGAPEAERTWLGRLLIGEP